MTQYISKSALVAEIERRRRDWRYGSSIEAKYKREECDDILSLIDTLKVREYGVDIGSKEGDIGVKTIWDGDKIVNNKVQKGDKIVSMDYMGWIWLICFISVVAFTCYHVCKFIKGE